MTTIRVCDVCNAAAHYAHPDRSDVSDPAAAVLMCVACHRELGAEIGDGWTIIPEEDAPPDGPWPIFAPGDDRSTTRADYRSERSVARVQGMLLRETNAGDLDGGAA